MSVIPQGGLFPIEIFQGGTYERTFEFFLSDQVTPRPLTGYTTGQAEMRDKEGGALLATFAVTVNQAAGTVKIRMEAAVTAAITKSGYYDVVLIHTNGDVMYVVEGEARINKRVTQVV